MPLICSLMVGLHGHKNTSIYSKGLIMGIDENIAVGHGCNSKHIDQELSNARSVYRDAYTTIHNLMATIKKGKKPDFKIVEPVIEKAITSLEQNSDALVSLCLNKDSDDYIFKHPTSTCIIAARFSQFLGHSADETKDIAIGALLGDIGKVFIPSKILYKPGKLTDAEYNTIKKHSSYSSKYIEKFGNFSELAFKAVSEHHERIDGTGYPHNLSGDQISVAGQVTAIADTYDAMTSVRMHQTRKEPTETLKFMLSKKDELFSETMIKQFIQCLGLYPSGTLVALNNGFIGVVLEQSKTSFMQPIVRLVYDLKKKRTIRPFSDVDIGNDVAQSGLKVISDVSKSKFSFQVLSAIG